MTKNKELPLARWLRAATLAQRDALKALLGPKTAGYLRHLAAGHRNASAGTAARIVAAMRQVEGIEPLGVEDLCPALAQLRGGQ